ncbi:peptidase C39 family protein [Glutamicibacter sp. NPDC087344]|uniref:peptidase C39 family protein n=1 Tax=Glutamicibacter sp. NPDC087344 TaxID=3363994 RepID=UPI003812AD9D
MAPHTAPHATVQEFDPQRHLPQLKHLGELGRSWTREAPAANARLLTISLVSGTVTGAALLTARSAGSYVKIAGLLSVDAATRERLIHEVLDYAGQQNLACVKWEIWGADSALAEMAEKTGFEALPAPRSAVERGSLADQESLIPSAGYVHWLHPASYLRTNHYRQSENFTCAAVAALAAHGETSRIGELDELRTAELTLWRQATNFMACEPIGLGLAIAQRWPEHSVAVSLDTEQPVIVDYYPEAERGWRGILQADSRRRAKETGLPLTKARVEISQIREAVGDGARVLLLVSLQQMLGYDVPHWVLCHGSAGSADHPVLVIDDSWVNEDSAESWVDVACLPIAHRALDEMSCLEADGYRAALTLNTKQSSL